MGSEVQGSRVHRKSEPLIRGIWEFVGFSSVCKTVLPRSPNLPAIALAQARRAG
jgi:hypothetical protein